MFSHRPNKGGGTSQSENLLGTQGLANPEKVAKEWEVEETARQRKGENSWVHVKHT